MKRTIKHFYRAGIRPFYKSLAILVFLSAVILLSEKPARQADIAMKHFSLVQFNDSPLSELPMQGIIEALEEYGMIMNRDYRLHITNAQGDMATLNLLIDAVVTDRPDLVFLTSTPTLQTAVRKIRDIPVVFTVVADPVIAGAGASFTDHLDNVTGISTLGDYEGMIKIVKEFFPDIRTIGTLFTPGESNSVKNLDVMRKHAMEANIELIAVPVNSSQEITDAMLALAARRPELICQIIDNLTSMSSGAIIRLAREQRIPVFGFVSDQVKQGAVLVVSRDYHQAGKDAVRLAVKILDGASPGDIPFEFVSRTEIMLNYEAAGFFNIRIPASLRQNPELITIN